MEVLQGAHALFHLGELVLAQALDARLHGLDPAVGEGLDLPLAEVALGLDKHFQIKPLLRKLREQLVDVLHVDDVVHESEPRGVVAAGEDLEFFEDLRGGLGAELHGLRVQPAERAVVFLAPPAPARALVQEDAVEALRALRVHLIQQLEVIVVVGRAGLLEFGEEVRARLEPDCVVLAIGHAGRRLFLLLAVQELSHQRRERHFPFAHHDIVDPGPGAQVLQPHLAVVVGPPEHDRDGWVEVLDEFRHRQAGDVLIERGGKADDRVSAPVDLRQHPRQVLRGSLQL